MFLFFVWTRVHGHVTFSMFACFRVLYIIHTMIANDCFRWIIVCDPSFCVDDAHNKYSDVVSVYYLFVPSCFFRNEIATAAPPPKKKKFIRGPRRR